MRRPLVRVMNLRRKIEIAIEYGLARDRDDIAAKLRPAAGDLPALSPKTLDWWINGDGIRKPEHMPADAFENFVALFAQRLAIPDSALRELLRQPADHLEDALAAANAASLDRIIARDATRDGARVILRSDELSLSEEHEFSSEKLPVVSLGEAYRLVFAASPQLSFAVVLQNAGHAWGAMKSQLRRDQRSLLVPGTKEDGSLRYLVEREQTGVHRFIAFRGRHPFPASLADYRNLPITLDRQALQLLAAHHENLPKSERAVCLIEVMFRDER